MTYTIEIFRFWQDINQTSGNCTVLDPAGFPLMSALSLERGWILNVSNISCIPIGEYDVVLEWSSKFGKYLWEIKGVPGRTECKFHAANYWMQLNGCIALGREPKDINGDGYRDVTKSKSTMKIFEKALTKAEKVKLVINGAQGVF